MYLCFLFHLLPSHLQRYQSLLKEYTPSLLFLHIATTHKDLRLTNSTYHKCQLITTLLFYRVCPWSTTSVPTPSFSLAWRSTGRQVVSLPACLSDCSAALSTRSGRTVAAAAAVAQLTKLLALPLPLPLLASFASYKKHLQLPHKF